MAMKAPTTRINGYDHSGGMNEPGFRESAIDVPLDFVPQPKVKPTLSGSLSREDSKVKKYQLEIKQKKDNEARLQREEDFLRASLRESKKLQNLEKRAPPQGMTDSSNGFMNAAYDHDAGETDSHRDGASAGFSTKAKSVDDELQVDMQLAIGMQQILALMNALRSKLGEGSNELRAMNQLFNNVKFQDAISLFNQVQSDPDSLDNSSEHHISPEIYQQLQQSNSLEARKLRDAINRPPFRDALLPYDLRQSTSKAATLQINGSGHPYQFLTAQSGTTEVSARMSAAYPDSDIKLVTINKTADPLGATVRNDGDSVVVGRIVKGGAAEKSGLIHEGDELLEVNDIPLRGKMINEVSDLLANLTGELCFLVAPGESSTLTPLAEPVTVRALFNYDPEKDSFIPCEELGISFQTGDILQVIDQSDPHWWQAYREREEDQALAGLIPSKTFWEMREQVRLTILAENEEAQMQTSCCARKRRHKSRFDADDVENEEILTYEEVSQYFPQPNRKRPIVLIGPPDVGRKELREKLQDCDPDRFAAAIPHTSRPRREDEVDGKDYFFQARHLFEADIKANKFVEHGQFQKDYYGTSLVAIRNVVDSGKICILNLHPQALKMLRQSDVKPYVVFIAPPSLDRLRQNILDTTGREVSVDHCTSIIDKGREIENKYEHYFDFIISNKDMDSTFTELLAEINRLEISPQWIPTDWLQ